MLCADVETSVALALVELLCAGALAVVAATPTTSVVEASAPLDGAGRLRSDLVSLARVFEVLVVVALGPVTTELMWLSVLLFVDLGMLRKVPWLDETIAEEGNILFFATVLNSNLLSLSLIFFSFSILVAAADLVSRRPWMR